MANNVVCKKCNNLVNGWCEKVIDSPDPDMSRDCQHFCEKTNADLIRAMSDEELAKFMNLCEHDFPPYCDVERSIIGECDQNCIKCAEEWLKQPVEGE